MMMTDDELDFELRDLHSGSAARQTLLPEQEQVLELIAHLASYGDMMVLVTGPDGSGKTLLAHTLTERRLQTDDALLITADLMLGIPALLRQIGAHWNISVPSDLVAARELIRQEAQQRADAQGPLLLVLDQAEQLDSDTLNDIAHFALLAPQALNIILFGRNGFEQMLRGGPAQAPVHIQPLQPLTEDGAQHLLQQVYAPGNPLPLSQQECALIYQKAQGWPGPLLLQAGDYFLAAQPADAPEPVRQGRARPAGRFPIPHILAVAALVTALGLSFLYRSDPVPETETVLPAPVDFLRGTLPDTLPATDALIADAVPAAMPPMGQPDGLLSDGEPDYNYQRPDPIPEAEVAPAATPVIAPPPTPAAARSVAPSPVPAPTRPAAAAPASPAVAAAAVRPSSVSPDDRNRLLAAKDGYVVQLFGSHEAANADKFRQQWRDEIIGTLYLYETRHNSKPWFVVVAGVYGTRAEATAAVNALPRPLRGQSPWIRDITTVQQALR